MCGCMLRYTDTLEVRRLEDNELEELHPDSRETLLKYHRTFRDVRNKMSKPGGPAAVIASIKNDENNG